MRRAELFGPPGVGKTTLFNMLKHRPVGIPNEFPVDGFVEHSHFSMVDVLASVADRPELKRWHLMMLRAVHFDSFLQTVRLPGVHLCDEFLCQNARLLRQLLPGEPAVWRAYAAALPVADRVVLYCVASVVAVIVRGTLREKPGLMSEEVEADFAVCSVVCEGIRMRGGKVITLDFEVAGRVPVSAARGALERI